MSTSSEHHPMSELIRDILKSTSRNISGHFGRRFMADAADELDRLHARIAELEQQLQDEKYGKAIAQIRGIGEIVQEGAELVALQDRRIAELEGYNEEHQSMTGMYEMRISQLEAIVGRLPKTADGVRLDELPGGCLWVVHSGEVLPCRGIGRGSSSWDVLYAIPDGRDMWIRFDRSYSTERAALDAAGGKSDEK
jgi:hypothetical protein